MKRFVLLSTLLSLLAVPAFSAEIVADGARIDSVTVYRDRAEVVRTATVSLPGEEGHRICASAQSTAGRSTTFCDLARAL